MYFSELILHEIVFEGLEVNYWIDDFEENHEAGWDNEETTYGSTGYNHVSQIGHYLQHVEQVPHQIEDHSDIQEQLQANWHN